MRAFFTVKALEITTYFKKNYRVHFLGITKPFISAFFTLPFVESKIYKVIQVYPIKIYKMHGINIFQP